MQRGFSSILIAILITAFILVVLGAWGYQNNFQNIRKINSFEDCAKAGYPVMESYPEQCNTPDGQHFVQELSEEEKERLNNEFDNLDSVQDDAGGWKTFENKKLGYTIKYPSEWMIRDEDGSGELYMLSQQPDEKGFIELQNEITIDLAPGQSAEDYFNNTPGFGIEYGIKYKVIDVNDNLAYLNDSGKGIHGSSTLLIKHKEKYLMISFSGYDYSEIEQIVRTLEFTDN